MSPAGTVPDAEDAARRAAWDAAAWRRALAPAWPGLAVEVVAETGSTSSDLLERVRRGDASPRLLVALHQTQGRGRHGRSWRSAPGASLTASFALPVSRADWSGLSLAIGVALADALDDAATPRIGVKWPNDLWLLEGPGRGRKLAGVLIEAVAGATPRVAVIGIGANVAPLDSAAGEAQAAPTTDDVASLAELQPGIDARGALERVAPALLEAVRRFDAEGFGAFRAAYARRDALAGCAVATTLAEAPHGTALGVTPRGALVLRTQDGRRVEVTSGDVSVRPVAPAT